MKTGVRTFLLGAGALVIAACAGPAEEKEPLTNESLASMVPPNLRKGGASEGKGEVEREGNYFIDKRARAQYDNSISATRSEDIIFTKPGDTEITVNSELKEIFKREYEGPWLLSYAKAAKLAQKEKKPLLIWFTSTNGNPFTRALDKDIFSANEFGEWAAGEVVRLKFDDTIDNITSEEGRSKEDYVKSMKAKYKVRGLPYVLLQLPDGSIFSRYRGYKTGNRQFYFGRIQNDVNVARKSIDTWSEEMESKGYRIWTDRKKRTIFAKPSRVTETRLSLIEPSGRRSGMHLADLSSADKKYIAERRKAARN